jgi:tetratricopeptide (TPR) repeat protein
LVLRSSLTAKFTNMIDWLRPLWMMFYAPARAMSEVRERAPLAPAAMLALLTQGLFLFYVVRLYLGSQIKGFGPVVLLSIVLQSAGLLLLVGLVFVPIAIFLANVFERRASFKLIIQQEYTATASTVLYAWSAASLVSIVLVFVGKVSNLQAGLSRGLVAMVEEQQRQMPPDVAPLLTPQMLDPQAVSAGFSLLLMLFLFGLWAIVAVREVFRLSWWRAGAIVVLSGVLTLPAMKLLLPIFSAVLASPFLLLLLFFLLRGYFGEVSRTSRARASFKQNLEAATLNPADASAHYNLGLIHQQRNELAEARQRFERAIEIDGDEVDAHYQLGRIARAQGRLPEAISHFEQVVARSDSHAQQEIWREIGATYLAAGQFDDARDALSRFLEHRQSDPEGLYLMGRTLAGLGRRREAASTMQACIEAVKTAPAYKYRTEKRWLNEAQQFLRTQLP